MLEASEARRRRDGGHDYRADLLLDDRGERRRFWRGFPRRVARISGVHQRSEVKQNPCAMGSPGVVFSGDLTHTILPGMIRGSTGV